MATRQKRLAEFTSSGEPPAQTCEILCEDHNGTYMPRFLGRFSDGPLAQLRYRGACGGFGRWLAPAAGVGQATAREDGRGVKLRKGK